MTRTIVRSASALLVAVVALCSPRPVSAQQMSFSYYTDSYFGADGQTLYTIIDGHDYSTGCSHWGYQNTGYVSGPSGYFQQTFSGLSNYMGVPLAAGTYVFWSDAFVDCSCFGTGLGAGGGFDTVPVDQIPSGEYSTVSGWYDVKTEFLGHLEGGTFTGRVVREQDGGNDVDTCYWPGSERDEFVGVLGGQWTVSGSDSYGPDRLGWAPADIRYYRSHGPNGTVRAPCQAETDQVMQINQPGSRWVKYTTNRLKNGIGVSNVWNFRDGEQTSIDWQ